MQNDKINQKIYPIIKNWWNDLRWATIFLTRIPATKLPGQNPKQQGDTLRTAPLVGLIVAIPTALTLIAILKIIKIPIIAAAAAIIAAILITGALHEDGLADTIDGFGAGKDKKTTQKIMQDSNIGTYATIAICITLLLKIVAIENILIHKSPKDAVIAITLGAIWSRTIIVPFIAYTPPATKTGSGAKMSQISKNATLYALITAAILITLILLTNENNIQIKTILLILALTIISTLIIRRLAIKKIDGHTGDVSGAVQQITETLTLMICTL